MGGQRGGVRVRVGFWGVRVGFWGVRVGSLGIRVGFWGVRGHSWGWEVQEEDEGEGGGEEQGLSHGVQRCHCAGGE